MHIAAVAWQVRSRVRKALLDLYGANETEGLLIKRRSIQAQCLELLQQQLDAGDISGVVVNQASIDFHATVIELLDARKRQAEARVELADAIGVPVKAIDGIDILFNGFEGLPSTLPKPEARRQALLNRVDVLAALAVYQASQSSLQLEIARQYPDIDIGPGYEYDQGDNKWALGVSLTLPILNQNRGAIGAAEARRTEAAAEFTALQSHILGQIERAVAGLNASMDKARTAEVIAEKLEQKATTMQKMFEAGEVLMLAVAGARLEQNSNALLLLRARIEVQEAVGQLEDAMQSPADLSDWRETILQSDIGKRGTS
jgi:outer membrane protein TolC